MECTKGFYDELVRIESEIKEYDLDDLYWYQDKVAKIRNVIGYLAFKASDEFELEELAGVHEKAYEVTRRINKRIIKLERSKQNEHDNNE